MRFDVLTLFPAMFAGPLDESILKRAQDAGLIEVARHQLRDWATDKHHTVDDYPFGGGPGMVMKPDPLFAAVEAIQPRAEPLAEVVLLTPQGRRLDGDLVRELAVLPRLLLICGRYEGVDERVREHLVDREVSIGDIVLSGGALDAPCPPSLVHALLTSLGARNHLMGDPEAVRAIDTREELSEGPSARFLSSSHLSNSRLRSVWCGVRSPCPGARSQRRDHDGSGAFLRW